jgi:hypothetical protein
MEIHNLDIRNIPSSKGILYSGIANQIHVDYYWENNGELHRFPKRGKYEEDFAGNVEIIESRYQLYIGNRCIEDDGCRWLLYIDGKFIGDVDGYDDSGDILYVDVVVGAG